VTFPRNSGAKRRVTIDRVEFTGYGLDVPAFHHTDYAGKNVKSAIAVWLGHAGPREIDQNVYRLLLAGRSRYAIDRMGAAAAIGPMATDGDGRDEAHAADRDGATATSRGNLSRPVDFTTVQRFDTSAAPSITAGDEFFTFLFSRAPEKYEQLKRLA